MVEAESAITTDDVEKGVDYDIISKWIERYYEEKLDKRDRRRGLGAYPGKATCLLGQQLCLN